MDTESVPDRSKHLVLLVHGINTRAQWMSQIKPALEDAGFAVEATSFGNFSIPRFVLPFSWFRKGAIERVARAIAAARLIHNPSQMSVISHSFGTFVIAQILADRPEFEWNRIIFCGSVVRDDYRLDLNLRRFNEPLLNEVGSRDIWPALAESITWGYGSVGSNGYNAVGVSTRWHSGLRHSDFLTAGFCKEFWIPFLRDGKILPADEPSELPLPIRWLASLPLRWLQPVLVLLLLITASSFIPGDSAANSRESAQTRINSFTLHRPGESFEPGDRFWTHPVDDRWVETYPSGFSSTFGLIKRASAEGCDGSIIAKQGEPSLQLFVPDRTCEQMVLKWRRRSEGWIARFSPADLKWRDLSLMHDVN
jgi:pimeloyl-ACP methyl ester carboxylesterase